MRSLPRLEGLQGEGGEECHCPQKGLSSWAYQSQHRGRLLAGGAKRQLLLPPQPPPPHTLDLSSPDFVTPPQTQTQGQKHVCSQMHKERKRNIKCAYASVHHNLLSFTHRHTYLYLLSKISHLFHLFLVRHKDAVYCIKLALNDRPFPVSTFGRRPEDVLPTAPATRPYAPLNHVVLSPCCAPMSNYNHDGRHQMICL